jgi:nucleoside-diphosphate-sugar epimerase
MSNADLSKIKGQLPVSVIVHGGNYISFLLAKTLLEQGSHVVIIDKYTNTSKQYFTELKKSGKVSFIDFKGIKAFYDKVARIDYLYYMLGEKAEESKNVDSKDFLAEADYLNQSLTAANKYKAKISLVTSLRLNRELSNLVNNEQTGKAKPYTPLELQRYGENFCAEYVDKTKANLRIIRLGTIIGRGVTKISDPIVDKLFTDATQKAQIEIEGEGLEIHNLIHESDAVYGILKLTFSDDTKGEVISLCNNNDYSTLSIAYKLLELDVEAEAIKFVESTNGGTILQDLYVPAPHASQYGWRQNVSLEEATIQQVQAYYEKADKKWEVDKTEREKKSHIPHKQLLHKLN